MRTITLSFDAESMRVDSSSGKFSVEIEALERDVKDILEQIGVSNIVSELKDEILDEIGSDYCAEYFDLEASSEEV